MPLSLILVPDLTTDGILTTNFFVSLPLLQVPLAFLLQPYQFGGIDIGDR